MIAGPRNQPNRARQHRNAIDREAEGVLPPTVVSRWGFEPVFLWTRRVADLSIGRVGAAPRDLRIPLGKSGFLCDFGRLVARLNSPRSTSGGLRPWPFGNTCTSRLTVAATGCSRATARLAPPPSLRLLPLAPGLGLDLPPRLGFGLRRPWRLRRGPRRGGCGDRRCRRSWSRRPGLWFTGHAFHRLLHVRTFGSRLPYPAVEALGVQLGN